MKMSWVSGFVPQPDLRTKDWKYSSFNRYVEKGVYEREWGVCTSIRFASGIGME
jgi:hypothetical protein